jgi:iron complex outermembrane receptor protein
VPRRGSFRFRAALLVGLASAPAWAEGQDSRPSQPKELLRLGLEQLMDLEVTSVSKKEQRLSQVAAAVYVITREDIRRSGATSIPEALRMAPGVQVSRIDANKWAVGVRGFNGRWSNKLLVLMDGRSVYSPMFSGVYWDVQDTFLEDVERIEVIRGPGGTMWGANAVNGVINVITRHARDTQGGLLTAGGGSQELGFGGARYGGKTGKAYYRGYAKFFQRNRLTNASGAPGGDDWNALRGGFRMDWEPSERDAVTVQGDLYQNHAGGTVATFSLRPPFSGTSGYRAAASGGNVLARWKRVLSERSETVVQIFFDRARNPGASYSEAVDTYDLEFQHRLKLGSRHDMQWGLGGRFISDDMRSDATQKWVPASRKQPLFSAFWQDEIALVENRLSLTLGSKGEHNVYTGFEFEPSARLAWTPNARSTVWASLARAVRTPARIQRDARVDIATFPGAGGSVSVLSLFGSSGFGSEKLRAHELGYRFQPVKRISLDLAAFYNVYNRLKGSQRLAPFYEPIPAPAHLVIPLTFNNRAEANSYGLELVPAWSVTEKWKLSASYSWLRAPLELAGTGERDSPRRQARFQSYLDLPWKLSLDTALYYVSSLHPMPGSFGAPEVPAHTRLDTRLGWKPGRDIELSVAAQNLLDSRQVEFNTPGDVVPGNQVRRSIYGKIAWRF